MWVKMHGISSANTLFVQMLLWAHSKESWHLPGRLERYLNTIILFQENAFQYIVCKNGGHFVQASMGCFFFFYETRSWIPCWLLYGLRSTSWGPFHYHMSYAKISQSLQSARSVTVCKSIWNLTGGSAAVLPEHLSNSKSDWETKRWYRVFEPFQRS